MRRRLAVIVLIVLIVGASIAVFTLRANFPHYTASVRGQLLISGGPPPGTPRPSEGEVSARNASGQVFAVSVPSTGEFTLPLPAGRYALTGTSPQFGAGQYKCFAPRKVTVQRDKSVHE